MGYGPPPELKDPDEMDGHYAMAVKWAPIHCFHCTDLGHMKTACFFFNSENPGKLNAAQPPPKQGTSQAQNEGFQDRMNAMESRVEKRLKKQMDEMEKRMLDTISGLNRPRSVQKSHNNYGPNQTKAVRTPDESVDDVDLNEPQDSLFDVTSEEQIPRQDHVKISKLNQKKQLSLLECGVHQVTKELE